MKNVEVRNFFFIMVGGVPYYNNGYRILPGTVAVHSRSGKTYTEFHKKALRGSGRWERYSQMKDGIYLSDNGGGPNFIIPCNGENWKFMLDFIIQHDISSSVEATEMKEFDYSYETDPGRRFSYSEKYISLKSKGSVLKRGYETHMPRGACEFYTGHRGGKESIRDYAFFIRRTYYYSCNRGSGHGTLYYTPEFLSDPETHIQQADSCWNWCEGEDRGQLTKEELELEKVLSLL